MQKTLLIGFLAGIAVVLAVFTVLTWPLVLCLCCYFLDQVF